jgi:hypothetical protein
MVLTWSDQGESRIFSVPPARRADLQMKSEAICGFAGQVAASSHGHSLSRQDMVESFELVKESSMPKSPAPASPKSSRPLRNQIGHREIRLKWSVAGNNPSPPSEPQTMLNQLANRPA